MYRRIKRFEFGPPRESRFGIPLGVGMAAAILFGTRAGDASAAAFGSAASSFGLLTALMAVLVVRAWQTHLLFASLSTIGGLFALVAGIALIWRYSGVPRAARFALFGPTGVGANGEDEPAGGLQILLPQGVDRQQLLSELRCSFIALQAAWDKGAADELAQLTTPEMLQELCAARSVGYGMAQRSEVQTLQVHLIAFEIAQADHLVCVEFSGLIREALASAPDPFRELWMLTRSADGSGGWRLAKHQALL